MPGTSFDADFEPQDQAEALDDTRYDDAGDAELRTFEELPDVLDVTAAEGDRDDDEALALDADEFDEDAIDGSEFEEDNELDYRAAAEDADDIYDGDDDGDVFDTFDDDAPGLDEVDGVREVRDAAEATGGADASARYESRRISDEDLQELGYLEEKGMRGG
jgi:hypothetical protein